MEKLALYPLYNFYNQYILLKLEIKKLTPKIDVNNTKSELVFLQSSLVFILLTGSIPTSDMQQSKALILSTDVDKKNS